MSYKYENEKEPSKKEIIVKKCVNINTAFKNMRIRHIFIIFWLIWGRLLMGTFLNTLLLTSESGLLLNKFTIEFINFLTYLTSQKFAILNLILILSLIIILIIASLQQFKSHQFHSKFVIWITIYQYTFNPFLIRYSIKIMTQSTKMNIWLFIKILAFIFIGLSTMHQILFYVMSSNPQTKNQNFLVRQRRYKMFVKEFMTYLLVLFGSIAVQVSQNAGGGGIFIIAVHILIGLIPLYILSTSFLYHNETVQIIFSLASCLELAICLVSFLDCVIQQPLIIKNSEIITIAITLFLFIACREYVGYRNHKLILSEVSALESRNSLKLYAHIIAQSLLNITYDNTKLQFILNSLKNQHKETCTQDDCICHKKIDSQDRRIELQKFLIKNKINKIISKGENNFEITVFCCYFKLTYFMAFPDLLYKLNEIKTKEHFNFIQIIQYQCFKSDLNKFLNKKKKEMNTIETQKVQQQDKIIIFIARTIEQIASNKYLYWLNLGKKVPDFKIINESVQRQIKLMNEFDAIMPRILQQFIRSKVVLMFVCLYEVFIKIKSKIPDTIKQGLRNYFHIRNQQIKVMKKQKFKIQSIMFEQVCVMFESQIQKDNMGIILNVSKNITKVFGYTRETIIGQNINEIMPKSMQKQHDVILESWRERASWANIHKTRYIFAMTKDNVCFESAIYLRIVQRMDSVNLLAAFMKVNENDYMIINEQGIIDGVGMSFKQTLGFKVPKLPFELICPRGSQILALAKKGNTSNASCTFYHVKGLQQLIQQYQYTKYQLNGNEQQQQLSVDKIKSRDRALNLTFQYRPYRMGSLFFVILKLIDHYKIKINTQNNLQIDQQLHNNVIIEQNKYGENESKSNGNATSMSCITKHSQQTQQPALNMYQNNSSVNTSQYDSSVTNEKVFTHLQEKFKQNSAFKCSVIQKYTIFIIGFCILAVIMILIEYTYARKINEVVDNLVKETFLFVERSNSLNLIYSRFQNLQRNFNDTNYQVQRSLIEIKRIQDTILNMNLDLYHPNTLPGSLQLNMSADWMTDSGEKEVILFEQEFTYFLIWIKDFQEKYLLKNDNQTLEYGSSVVSQNLMLVEQYITKNFIKLKESVIVFLNNTSVFSKVKVGILSVILLAMTFLLWKSKSVQYVHHESILKVLLSISDRNCQHCSMYFRKITNILVACREQASRNGNQAEFVQKQLISKDKLQAPFEQLQIQKDKFERNKYLKYTGYKKQYYRTIVILISALFVSFLIYTLVAQNDTILKQMNFMRSYFNFTQAQIEIVEEFLTAKSQALDYSYSAENAIEFNKNKEGMLNKIFLDFIETSQIIYAFDLEVEKFTGKQTLCQTIRKEDQEFYRHNCMPTSSFPYSRLKIYEANSLIETYITNLMNDPRKNAVNQTQKISNIQTLQQTVNLRYISLCKMFDHLFAWLAKYRINKMSFLCKIISIQISTFLILVFIIWYFSTRICENMNKNCWSITVIPQIVLKYTKGAMKHVAEVLNYLK